jgi:two-component system, NarL family, invasion response regulator UvrY
MNQQTIIKVAIADDHLPTRTGLKVYSEMDGDIVVIYEAGNGQQMLDILNRTDQLPDVCLIDIHMPVMDGAGLLQAIKAKWPHIKCLAITADDYHPLVLRMIRFGVNGYLIKSLGPDELVEAIRTVHRLGYYYSEMAGKEIFQMVHSNKVRVRRLDQEELSFLAHICTELSYEEIAKLMGMSTGTVNNLRKKLFQKFNVYSRTSLALAAVAEALIPNILPHQIKS